MIHRLQKLYIKLFFFFLLFFLSLNYTRQVNNILLSILLFV